MKLLVSTTCLLTFLWLTVPVFAQTPSPTPPDKSKTEDNEIIRISSDLVLVDALVLDKDGQQITNLSAEDFEVLQDGKPQKIINFGYVNPGNATIQKNETTKSKTDKKSIPLPPVSVRSNSGRVITFVIDDGNCLATQLGTYTARDAMKKFISEQMLPNDKVAIYRTRGGSSLLQLYTSNKEVLSRIVDKVNWFPSACGSAFEASKDDSTFKAQRGGGSLGKDTFESDGDAQFRKDNANSERDKQIIGTIGVLNFVVERLKNLPQRKIVFFLSEGIQISNNSQMISGSRAMDALREVSDKASRSSVVIYTMSNKGVTIPGMLSAEDQVNPGITGGTGNGDQIKQDRDEEERSLNDGMSYLAYTTGGKFISNQNFLDTGIKEVLSKETGYYLIGYQPEGEAFNGKDFHKIEIHVKRPELRVSSRKGFYGRTDTETKTKNRSAETPLYQAIVSPLQENGMDIRLTTLVGNDQAEGSYIRAIFHVKGQDLTFIDEADGTKKTVLDVVAVTLDEKGKVVDEFNHSYTVHIPKQGVQTLMQNGLDYSADMPIKNSGVYSFRLAVRDNNSKRLGSAGDFVEIPDLKKGKFFMTGLVTTTITNAGKPLLPKTRQMDSAFVPVFVTSIPSIRQYIAGEVVAYTYNIFNAKLDAATKQPKLTTQLRLYKNGKLLVEGKETPADLEAQPDMSRIQDYGLMRLNPKAEVGEYILQIIVKDTLADKTVSQWIDFEVVQ
jgi:VWFA-related protein